MIGDDFFSVFLTDNPPNLIFHTTHRVAKENQTSNPCVISDKEKNNLLVICALKTHL